MPKQQTIRRGCSFDYPRSKKTGGLLRQPRQQPENLKTGEAYIIYYRCHTTDILYYRCVQWCEPTPYFLAPDGAREFGTVPVDYACVRAFLAQPIRQHIIVAQWVKCADSTLQWTTFPG